MWKCARLLYVSVSKKMQRPYWLIAKKAGIKRDPKCNKNKLMTPWIPFTLMYPLTQVVRQVTTFFITMNGNHIKIFGGNFWIMINNYLKINECINKLYNPVGSCQVFFA